MANNDYTIPLIIGAGVLGYFLLKDTFKGVATATEGIGSATGTIATETGESFKAVTDLFQNSLNKVQDIQNGLAGWAQNVATSSKTGNSTIKTAGPITFDNPIAKAQINNDSAFGYKTQTLRDSKGNSSTIIAKPNTYYANLGVGFDSKGNGYSSISQLRG